MPLTVGVFEIGRGKSSDIRLGHRSVSRKHATLSVLSDSASLVDHNSLNGTFVKGARVRQLAIVERTAFRIGVVECEFAWGPPPGQDVVTSTVDGPELSPAESRVLDMVLQGLSEKEMAHKLNLSPHTVHNHIKRIYREFEVHTRAELLVRLSNRRS